MTTPKTTQPQPHKSRLDEIVRTAGDEARYEALEERKEPDQAYRDTEGQVGDNYPFTDWAMI